MSLRAGFSGKGDGFVSVYGRFVGFMGLWFGIIVTRGRF